MLDLINRLRPLIKFGRYLAALLLFLEGVLLYGGGGFVASGVHTQPNIWLGTIISLIGIESAVVSYLLVKSQSGEILFRTGIYVFLVFIVVPFMIRLIGYLPRGHALDSASLSDLITGGTAILNLVAFGILTGVQATPAPFTFGLARWKRKAGSNH